MRYIAIMICLLANASHASTLDTIVESIWKTDPLLVSQQTKIEAAERDKFARFLPNSPTLSFVDQDNHSWRTYGVSLAVGFPGKAFALSRIDRENVKAENGELFAKRIELASFILNYYGLCASSKELLSILEEATEELKTLKDVITARYEMGQSTQAERIGIELQHRQANIEYLSFQDQTKVSCAKLKQFVVDRQLDETILANPELPTDFSEDIISQLGTKSLEFIRAENQSRIAQTESEIAGWRVAPDITFSYYRNYYNRIVASPIIPVAWTNTFMVSMNVPILFPFYERNTFLKMRADQTIIARRALMQKLESERAVENFSFSFMRSKKIYKRLIEHDLPMAEAMVDSTFASYKQGKLGFSELILAKRTWLDLKKEEVDLKLDMLNARLKCLNSCERN